MLSSDYNKAPAANEAPYNIQEDKRNINVHSGSNLANDKSRSLREKHQPPSNHHSNQVLPEDATTGRLDINSNSSINPHTLASSGNILDPASLQEDRRLPMKMETEETTRESPMVSLTNKHSAAKLESLAKYPAKYTSE